jgi:hypothetical protein
LSITFRKYLVNTILKHINKYTVWILFSFFTNILFFLCLRARSLPKFQVFDTQSNFYLQQLYWTNRHLTFIIVEKLIHLDWPSGVDLGPWSLLLLRSHVWFPLVSNSVDQFTLQEKMYIPREFLPRAVFRG